MSCEMSRCHGARWRRCITLFGSLSSPLSGFLYCFLFSLISIADLSHAGAESLLGVSIFNYLTPPISASLSPLWGRRCTAGEKQQNANKKLYTSEKPKKQNKLMNNKTTTTTKQTSNVPWFIWNFISAIWLFLKALISNTDWTVFHDTCRTAYVKHSCQRKILPITNRTVTGNWK